MDVSVLCVDVLETRLLSPHLQISDIVVFSDWNFHLEVPLQGRRLLGPSLGFILVRKRAVDCPEPRLRTDLKAATSEASRKK